MTDVTTEIADPQARAEAVSAAWERLAALRAATSDTPIAQLFDAPNRFEHFSLSLGDLLLDASKTSLTEGRWPASTHSCARPGVEARRDAMFAGAHINITEDRAVLHTALRDTTAAPLLVDGQDVKPEIREDARPPRRIRRGRAQGHHRRGPRAGLHGRGQYRHRRLRPRPGDGDAGARPYHDGPRLHFVSNVDGAHIHDVLKPLNPATTLIIIASKTFTTIETMTNARTARAWIADAQGEAAVGAHFAAVSTALDKVAAFGIDTPAPSASGTGWAGAIRCGRRWACRSWSPSARPCSRISSPAARPSTSTSAMRRWRRNLPALLAAVGLWHRNVCGYPTRAVIPYDQRLARLPAYLQQLDMESNGKSVTLDGAPVARPTGRWCGASRAPIPSTPSSSSSTRARTSSRWSS